MMKTEIERRCALAREIAIEAGNLAIKMRSERGDGFTSIKSHQDFVTEADLAVESLIRDRISNEFPQDAVLGEEQGQFGVGDAIWIVDPIDGTTNFMRGMVEWAISIAYCRAGKIECGVVYAPDISALAEATAGRGTRLNGKPIRISSCEEVNQMLILLGRSGRTSTRDYLDCIDRLLAHGAEYRRTGSAAYSLMMVAAGRAEAFFEAHINAWDVMAGILIVEEAGGLVRYPALSNRTTNDRSILASNSSLHSRLQYMAGSGKS